MRLFESNRNYNIDSRVLNNIRDFYDNDSISPEDIFFYVYAVLNDPEYLETYKNDLRKLTPRVPLMKDFSIYKDIGSELINLHLNYEKIDPYEGVKIIYKTDNPSFVVKKMKFAKKKDENGKNINDFTKIISYNKDITIENIPKKASQYSVNGRTPIEWVIDQYQVKIHKKTGIVDNPNDYSDDPKYIFNLLLSIINVSVQTVDLVNSLPPLEIIEE